MLCQRTFHLVDEPANKFVYYHNPNAKTNRKNNPVSCDSSNGVIRKVSHTKKYKVSGVPSPPAANIWNQQTGNKKANGKKRIDPHPLPVVLGYPFSSTTLH
ncbi:MAG TPA: hypothetical protein VJG85_00305 [Patescibacteria group bacterium]|nr:hypothetical protein [Patescibacteria group bacterium]